MSKEVFAKPALSAASSPEAAPWECHICKQATRRICDICSKPICINCSKEIRLVTVEFPRPVQNYCLECWRDELLRRADRLQSRIKEHNTLISQRRALKK